MKEITDYLDLYYNLWGVYNYYNDIQQHFRLLV